MKRYTCCLALLLISLLVSVSCGGGGGGSSEPPTYSAATASSTYSGTDPAVYHIDTSGYVNLTYTLDLGSSSKSVYFVFTNTATSSSYTNPTVSGNMAGSLVKDTESSIRSNILDTTPVVLQRGKPEISEFNRRPFDNVSMTRSSGLKSLTAPAPVKSDTVGGTKNFYNDSTSNTIPATCRGIYTAGSKTLSIWVANDCWTSGGTKDYLINQTMVDALAVKFLTGTPNIYSLVINIFGAEWGSDISSLYGSYVISSSNAGNITILLCDIDNDNTEPVTIGGTLGYFWGKDNFLTSPYGSNQRLMFYIDAVLYAYYTSGEGSWASTNAYPEEIYSTLAHEFQHMINFYQKPVVHGLSSGSDTWMDEMCAMMSEDFVAYYMGFKGPRGVAYNTAGPGTNTINTSDRLARFNYYNYLSLIDWPDSSSDTDIILAHYSMSYAFGAYLARNFGGVNLFHNIVQNAYTDKQAVTSALSSMSYSETFETALRKWGAAVVLSSLSSGSYTLPVPSGYSVSPYVYYYSDSSWKTSTINSTTYSLGSINLYNYRFYYTLTSYYDDPYFFTSGTVGAEKSLSNMNKTSNMYYKVGDSITGSNKYAIKLDDGVKLTVVVK